MWQPCIRLPALSWLYFCYFLIQKIYRVYIILEAFKCFFIDTWSIVKQNLYKLVSKFFRRHELVEEIIQWSEVVLFHNWPPFFAEMKQAINGNRNKIGLMIVSTSIINTKMAFTLADNVDVEVTVLRFCSNFMEFGIRWNLSYI